MAWRKRAAVIFAAVFTVVVIGRASANGVSLGGRALLEKPPRRIAVALYIESGCPDTTRFVNRDFTPTFEELHSWLDVHMVAFGKAKGDGHGHIICQHGQAECLGNRVLSCVQDLYTDPVLELGPFLGCFMKRRQDAIRHGKSREESIVLDDGKACASDVDSMTWSVVEACASGEQGEQLEQRMEKETLAFDPTGLKRVPTVTLDQSECKGYCSDFKKQVCERIVKANGGRIPKECESSY